MEMALRFVESLVAEFSTRKRVPLLDKPIMTTLLYLDRILLQSLLHTNTVSEALERR